MRSYLFSKYYYMNDLYKKAIEAYTEMLQIHIDTKTLDADFHKETEVFYESLFDLAHDVWEKHVDLWGQLNNSSLEEKKKRANEIIMNMRKEVESYAKNNEMSLGTEDMLGSLANTLEDNEWTSRAFL